MSLASVFLLQNVVLPKRMLRNLLHNLDLIVQTMCFYQQLSTFIC